MQTIIKGGQVVTATGQPPITDGIVAVDGERIAAVGTRSSYEENPPGSKIIDATGCSVLPGLIDVHVHVFMYPWEAGYSESQATVWATNYLRTALRAGVTTIRDLASGWDAIFALKRGVVEGWITGPRLLAAGQALTMTGGHGHNGGAVEVDGPVAAMRAARRQLKKGADVIKLMATGGVGTPGGELPTSMQLNPDEMAAAVTEAHKAGKPATAHAHGTEGIKQALRAGVDCIEHGVYLDDEAIELMLRDNVTLSPTLSVYWRIIEAGAVGMVPAFRVPKAEATVKHHAESFRRAVAAGVKIALGTDAVALHHPLGDVVYELELWTRNGMKSQTAIESATREAARVCQLEHEIGTIEEGKIADLLIVEGDVLAEMGNLRNVRHVMRAGQTVYEERDGGGHRCSPLPNAVAKPYPVFDKRHS